MRDGSAAFTTMPTRDPDVEGFLALLTASRAPATVAAYRRDLAGLGSSLRKPLADADVDELERWAAQLRADGLAGTTIARYIYQGHPLGSAATTVETGAYFIDPQARLDEADIERQIAWFKAQGLVEQSVDPHQVVDLSFLAAH